MPFEAMHCQWRPCGQPISDRAWKIELLMPMPEGVQSILTTLYFHSEECADKTRHLLIGFGGPGAENHIRVVEESYN